MIKNQKTQSDTAQNTNSQEQIFQEIPQNSQEIISGGMKIRPLHDRLVVKSISLLEDHQFSTTTRLGGRTVGSGVVTEINN